MRQVPLTSERVKTLRPAMWGGAEQYVIREINSGAAKLWESDERDLLLVTREEPEELVVVSAAGRDVARHQDWIISLAKSAKARAIRWHTRCPSHLIKATAGLPIELSEMRKQRFCQTEYVYKLKVNQDVAI